MFVGKRAPQPSEEDAPLVLSAMRGTRHGEESVIISLVIAEPRGRVLLKAIPGSTQVVDMLAGEMLPRIC